MAAKQTRLQGKWTIRITLGRERRGIQGEEERDRA